MDAQITIRAGRGTGPYRCGWLLRVAGVLVGISLTLSFAAIPCYAGENSPAIGSTQTGARAVATATASVKTTVIVAPDTLALATARILEPSDGVTLLHFHATKRCADCILIETYVRDYIEDVFAKEIEAGSLHYKLINIDLPENHPVADHYEIDDTMVVLTRWRGGEEQDWMGLWEVWDLVEDSIALTTYVGDEVITFLEAAVAEESQEAGGEARGR